MKTSMYFNYTSRSLLRGGQRTILAVFCIAVGVMAIVALQLAGFMLQNSLTANVRDGNGGDIALNAQGTPFKESDLAFFDQLKSDGTITNYTVISTANAFLSAVAPSFQAFPVEAVNPQNYPIVSPPTFVTPGNGSVSQLLTNDQVIVTQSFLDRYHKKAGDSFDLYIKAPTGSGEVLYVTIAGVIANTGGFAQAGNLVLISATDYRAAVSNVPATYGIVDLTTTDQAHTNAAVDAVNKQFPLVVVQTAADALKTQQSVVDNINKFLEIAGLLALLIGGVGIVNTMQVLLSRRKTEIAMLKTAGYRRMDLYTLFGLEAGLLGLVGGIIGAAAAIGVSYLVRMLLQNMGVNVLFLINPWTVAGGVAIGFATALIFGLMPIVQAATIRPLHVIRELPENRKKSSFVLTVGLLALLSLLFCALAIVILKNDVALGVEAVYGTFAFLLVLSAFFGLVVFVISKLPVPEKFNLKYCALVLLSIVAAILLYLALPAFGLLMAVVVLLGIALAFFPRSWKVSMKMALRNIGRQRARVTTTMLALFIGIFSIGLVLTLGQDLQAQINSAFTQDLAYNVIATTSGADTTALQSKLNTIPGLSKTRNDLLTQAQPVAINGNPVLSMLTAKGSDRQAVISYLSTIEGYNLASTTPTVKIIQGRNLNASDIGTNHIMLNELLTSTGPFQMNLKPGDTLTFASLDGKMTRVVTVVGIYNGIVGGDHVGNVLAGADLASDLSTAKSGVVTVTYMKIDPTQVNKALDRLGTIVPNATVQSLADLAASFAQQLNSVLETLIALASLSMLAGVVIIANAVALAMLERRRELGILKAVGYTSGTVLSEVMIENGIVGATGAFMAVLLAAVAVSLLGKMLFDLALSVSPLISFSLTGGATLLAILTAALVAWSAVRIRPLEVLRYE